LSELTNLHDRFLKYTFDRTEAAADFLANYLPPEIGRALDFSSVQAVKGTFVDPDLGERFSDLLYKVGIRNGGEAFIYILVEHKSAPDKWVGFQLLRYMLRIWESVAREGKQKLPPIFPLVLYHGRGKWRVAGNLGSLIDWRGVEDLKRYVPEYEYHLCDLTAYSEEEIRGAATLRISLLALKYVFEPELQGKLVEIIGVLKRLRSEDMDALECLRTVLEYLSRARGLTAEDVRPAIKQVFSGEEGRLMSNFVDEWIEKGVERGLKQGMERGLQEGRQEGLQEGRKEGLQEGRKEGLQEGRREEAARITMRLLERRMGPISARTGNRIQKLPIEQLEQLGFDLLDFSSRKDLTAWLSDHIGN
jgi:predicted transposase/invertase (TIGR01784 family)